jgi:hypothetical protein
MIVTLDIRESRVDAVMDLLKSLKDDVRIVYQEQDSQVSNVKISEADIACGRVKKIEDIDTHIAGLENAVK